jgi:hypothetical protein
LSVVVRLQMESGEEQASQTESDERMNTQRHRMCWQR